MLRRTLHRDAAYALSCPRQTLLRVLRNDVRTAQDKRFKIPPQCMEAVETGRSQARTTQMVEDLQALQVMSISLPCEGFIKQDLRVCLLLSNRAPCGRDKCPHSSFLDATFYLGMRAVGISSCASANCLHALLQVLQHGHHSIWLLYAPGTEETKSSTKTKRVFAVYS